MEWLHKLAGGLWYIIEVIVEFAVFALKAIWGFIKNAWNYLTDIAHSVAAPPEHPVDASVNGNEYVILFIGIVMLLLFISYSVAKFQKYKKEK